MRSVSCDIWKVANLRVAVVVLIAATMFSIGLAAPQGERFAEAVAAPPVVNDAGMYIINSCPVVWVENVPFHFCDVDDMVIAFRYLGLTKGARKGQAHYYISVWNTGGEVFNFHPQRALLTFREPYVQTLESGEKKVYYELVAVPFDAINRTLKKKERTAAILMAVSYAVSETTASSQTTATTHTYNPSGSTTSVTTVNDPARAMAMREMRMQALQQNLHAAAQETDSLLDVYAKSNTLTDGMMTAGRVMFPKFRSHRALNGCTIQVHIKDKRFLYETDPEKARAAITGEKKPAGVLQEHPETPPPLQ